MKKLKSVCIVSILIGTLSGEWTRIEGPPKLTVNDITIGYDDEDPNLQRIYFVDLVWKIFYKSENGGMSWVSLDDAYGLPQTVDPMCIITEPNNSKIVYVGLEGEKVYKSTDAGENWTFKGNGITNPYPRVFAMDPYDPNIVYLGCRGR